MQVGQVWIGQLLVAQVGRHCQCLGVHTTQLSDSFPLPIPPVGPTHQQYQRTFFSSFMRTGNFLLYGVFHAFFQVEAILVQPIYELKIILTQYDNVELPMPIHTEIIFQRLWNGM